jgi:fibronectin-binding autotransporter adhesin
MNLDASATGRAVISRGGRNSLGRSRRLGRRRQAGAVLATSALATLAGRAAFADTPDYFQGTSTNGTPTALDDPTNYSLGIVPTAAYDAVIDSTHYNVASALLTLGSSQTFGTLDVTNTLGVNSPYAITVQDAASANTNTLTLGGGGFSNAVAPSTSDLLYVDAGSTLTVNSSSGLGLLNIVLGSTGNFDVAGTATISSNISGGYALTKTGAGTLILSPQTSTNFYTGGTFINGGVLQVSTTNALGPSLGANISAGALRMTASVSSGRQFQISSGSSTIDASSGVTFTLSSSGPGTGLVGNGTLNVNATSAADVGVVGVYGTNPNFTGNVNIVRGTFDVGYNTSLGVQLEGTSSTSITVGTAGTLSFYNWLSGNNSNPIIVTGPTSAIGDGSGFAWSLLGVISGSGALNKTGVGTIDLLASNTYTGGTNISSGTLQYYINASVNSGNVSIGAATLEYHRTGYTGYGGTLPTNVSISSATSTIQVGSTTSIDGLTVTGAISGSGTLNKTGIGTLYLSPATGLTNSYTGGTNIASGTVDFTTIRGLPTLTSNAGPITMAAGTTFEYDGSGGSTNSLNTFNFSSAGAFNLDITGVLYNYGVISGAGQLVKQGSSTLELLSETAGTTTPAANTYTGGTNISAGTLELYGVGYELPSTGTVLLESGTTFEFYNTSAGAQSLPAVPFRLTSNTSTGYNTTFYMYANTATPGFILTLPGVISGNGTLVKAGSGGLSLTAANVYAGGTNVSAGTLVVSNANGFSGTGTGTVTVNGGTLAGTGFIGGPVVLNATGTITAGSGGTVNDSTGVLTSNNTHTWTAGSTYNVKIDASNASSGVAAGSGASGVPGVASDELVFNGLTASTGITVNPLFTAATVGSLVAGGNYSVIIADDSTGQGNSTVSTGPNTGVFDGLTIGTQIVVAPAAGSAFSLSTIPDGTAAGEDLVLDFTSTAPEPTSVLLLGATAAPMLLGRRRRAGAATA